MNSQNEHIGLLVDKVTDVLTTPVQDITDPPSNIKGIQGKFFKGVVHTSKNEILSLIDVEAVLAEDQQQKDL